MLRSRSLPVSDPVDIFHSSSFCIFLRRVGLWYSGSELLRKICLYNKIVQARSLFSFSSTLHCKPEKGNGTSLTLPYIIFMWLKLVHYSTIQWHLTYGQKRPPPHVTNLTIATVKWYFTKRGAVELWMKGPLNSSVTFDEDSSSVEENQLKRYLQRRILSYQKNHLGVDLIRWVFR